MYQTPQTLLSKIREKISSLEEEYKRSKDKEEKEKIKKELRKTYTVAISVFTIKSKVEKGIMVSADEVEKLKKLMPELSEELSEIRLPKDGEKGIVEKAWNFAGGLVNWIGKD